MGATDLADVLLTERGIDYRTAHRIVAKAVNAAKDRDLDQLRAELLDEAAEAVIGRKLELSPETIAETLDPTPSSAPVPVREAQRSPPSRR